jgi:hypothetical protein
MPIENLEDQGLEKNPDLELAHFKFLLTLPEYRNDRFVHAKITEAIKKDGKWDFSLTFPHKMLNVFAINLLKWYIFDCPLVTYYNCNITSFFL